MSTGVVNDPGALPRTDIICAQQARADDGAVFFAALRVSRLLAEDAVRSLEAAYRASPDHSLIDLVTADGTLTRYQFDRISDGNPSGLVIGPYRVLDEVGRGGGGAVYAARHAVMSRTVALKVIDPRYTADRSAVEVFRREVAATVRLDHPNVVRVYDAGECDGFFYIAMELLTGPTLHRHVTTDGPLAPPAARAALLQLAAALDHAHENGLVHRDIKPANVIVLDGGPAGPPGRVKLLDFGLARLHHPAGEPVSTIHCPAGAAIGTPAFMSPEQIRNFHAADIRSDLYSLGCTFYFALSGKLPFQGATTSATLMLQLNRDAVPLRSVCPAVPAGLARVVHRLMAKNPADRFQTPAELADAVNALILFDGTAEPPPPFPAPAPAAPVVQQTADSGSAPHPLVTPAARPALFELWRAWCEAVATGAGADGRPLTGAAYQTLHRQLLDGLRSARQEAGGAGGRWDWAASHVEPWVTLAALARLDERTRAQLYLACLDAGERLFPSAARSGRRGWLFAVVAALLFTVGFLTVQYQTRLAAIASDCSTVLTARHLIVAAFLVPLVAMIAAVAGRRARA